MTLFLLIKPWDYSSADADAFLSLQDARDARLNDEGTPSNKHYWQIQPAKIGSLEVFRAAARALFAEGTTQTSLFSEIRRIETELDKVAT